MVAEVLGSDVDRSRSPEEESLLYRLFGGALLAGFTMVVSIAISSGYGFNELRALGSDWDAAHWVLLLTAVPALGLLGPPVLRAAVQDLRSGRLTLEVLFALGTTSAVAASAASFLRGTGPVYLETATMLLALYTLGRYLEARARGETTRVLRGLLEVPAVYYERLRPDPDIVLHDALRIGDHVRIGAGDVLPVDGRVLRGQGFVDEATLTGENIPTTKSPGMSVFAGTTSVDATFTIRVTATGSERRLARIEELMRDAMARPPGIVQTTDRILRWLIPGVVVLALVTFAAWFAASGFEHALYASLSVVLIACPCALGLAIPLALNVALGGAARRGILIRSGQALLDLSEVRAVAMDKTGTLTETKAGRVRVVAPVSETRDDRVPVPAQNDVPMIGGAQRMTCAVEAAPDRMLAFAAAVETGMRHPLAEAICAEARRRGLDLPETVEAHVIPGVGVHGLLRDGDELFEVAVGSADVLNDSPASREYLGAVHAVEGVGSRALFVTVDAHPSALLAIREQPVNGARSVVDNLIAAGLHVEILSGDGSPATAALARRLGVPSSSSASPEVKLAHIAAMRRRYGPVAMVGDGLNDAAALAAADVGIALVHGAPLSVEAAAVTLYNPDLHSLPWLVRLARRTRRTIRQNLVWTFVYNGMGLSLAVAGLLHPLVAVVVMLLSSLFVSWNAHRLHRILPAIDPAAS